jgi:molybdenum-dependent DNA-binding transcriptional regulator ModE
MYTLEEAAQRLGIGYGALRDRLRALNESLEPYISRGKRGKLLLNENGLYVLQRMRELEKAGFSIADSAQAVRQELALRSKDAEEVSDSAPTNSAQAVDNLSAAWQLVEQLRQENAFLKEQISLKDEQINRLLQLALPPAKNVGTRRWWRFWSR